MLAIASCAHQYTSAAFPVEGRRCSCREGKVKVTVHVKVTEGSGLERPPKSLAVDLGQSLSRMAGKVLTSVSAHLRVSITGPITECRYRFGPSAKVPEVLVSVCLSVQLPLPPGRRQLRIFSRNARTSLLETATARQ